MRKICIITGSRAEYGHMRWLARDLRDDPEMDLTVLAGSAHLSPYHGNTIAEIEADGVAIERVDSLLTGDGAVATAKSMALALMGFAEALSRLAPHLTVILGDRFEMLAAAEAAMLLRIPIAHLHGGETTEGAIDEACRHAITKMAHLHFVAAEPYRQRVIQLGEAPGRVFNFGAPGLDSLTRLSFLTRSELEDSLGMALHDPVVLVTYHPVTLSSENQSIHAWALTEALGRFPDATVIITGVNADQSNSEVQRPLREYAQARSERVRLFDSLGSARYHSLLRLCRVVVGNSSSGIIEAPAHHVPTVNIGDRQKGRLCAPSVFHCGEEVDAIATALAAALSGEGQAIARESLSVYGQGDASRQIHQVLKTVSLDGLLFKTFNEVSWSTAP